MKSWSLTFATQMLFRAFWVWAFRHIQEYYYPQKYFHYKIFIHEKMLRKRKWQIPGEPLLARYNWYRGPAVEKHCSRQYLPCSILPLSFKSYLDKLLHEYLLCNLVYLVMSVYDGTQSMFRIIGYVNSLLPVESPDYQMCPLSIIFYCVISGFRCDVSSELLWDVTKRRLVVCHRRFGTTYQSHFQG